MTDNVVTKIAKALATIYYGEGAAAAQDAYRKACEGKKAWESRAIREAFQTLVKESNA